MSLASFPEPREHAMNLVEACEGDVAIALLCALTNANTLDGKRVQYWANIASELYRFETLPQGNA